MNRSRAITPIVASLILVLAAGCSSDPNPLAPFQPEIITTADAFQFQATAVTNVTFDRTYTWANPLTRATVNHASAVKQGTAQVHILDAAGTEVYTSLLAASGTQPTDTGLAGNWKVRVVLTNVSGTLNFRVEKL
jgi:hypothetical protein